MKKGVYVSLNCVVGIREFMANYMDIIYDRKEKLTHYEMEEYLIRHGRMIPKSVNYSQVRIEDIIAGKFVVVAEETKKQNKKGKIIIYENPKRLDIPMVMESLKRCNDKDDLKEARNRILVLENCYENSMGEIIDIDFDDAVQENPIEVEPNFNDLKIEKENRQKTYTLTSKRHIKGRKKY